MKIVLILKEPCDLLTQLGSRFLTKASKDRSSKKNGLNSVSFIERNSGEDRKAVKS